MHDMLIRGGTVVDGTGAAPFTADVAIADGRIVEVGRITAPARETIEADGAIVTPGFVDVHTHYDGQFLWDDTLEPSFSHGVTTAVGGNCGVGFAPVRVEHRAALIELMEGVEEIPGIVLNEGLDWRWQSFPDYLDRLAARHYTMDIASHITHAPLRVFVMGERALNHEAATADDITRMGQLVREAMDAGAIGVSGARVLEHLSSTGANVPGTFAADDELLGLAQAMGSSGHGTFQIIPLGANGDLMFDQTGAEGRRAEHDRIVRIAEAAGRPVTYSLLEFRADPDDWRMMIDESAKSLADGLRIHPQVGLRGVGAMTMLDGYHIFMLRPSYREIAHLPLAQRVVALREPGRRAAILNEQDDPSVVAADPKFAGFIAMLAGRIANIFPMTLPLDYEPGPERRLGALAAAAGVPMETYLYDHYAAGDGTNVCTSFMLNYAKGNLDATHDMLADPVTVGGLGDGGAHMKMICDSSYATFALTHWVRDRTRGPRLPLELVVRKLTSATADLYGLTDRGRIAVGQRADVNVIDHAALSLKMPRMAHDLPAGGMRLLQGSSGYLATMVAGTITRRNDAATGARPGRLIRSRPSAA
ncbi:N-acyl-D-amino-acid deacylase family protein [Sphingomonas solaris]|uniref:Amidohydrolase family protein n=1 Tax=Alterirhizorhabdus solaris TaxID=2529389 RepID=A0A558RBI2_9SPHN|nr:amidohydrolase family protein [Sphingomonas solaris]TVV76736.1 amidohydrolase family protein [Sphingomonas solaris]